MPLLSWDLLSAMSFNLKPKLQLTSRLICHFVGLKMTSWSIRTKWDVLRPFSIWFNIYILIWHQFHLAIPRVRDLGAFFQTKAAKTVLQSSCEAKVPFVIVVWSGWDSASCFVNDPTFLKNRRRHTGCNKCINSIHTTMINEDLCCEEFWSLPLQHGQKWFVGPPFEFQAPRSIGRIDEFKQIYKGLPNPQQKSSHKQHQTIRLSSK